MSDLQDVLIVGDGIAGLMSAYHLSKTNKKITILNSSSDIKHKASYGNAGLLSAFGKEPLSHNGVLFETIKMLFSKNNPMSFSNRLDIKTIKWAYRFFFNSTKKNTIHRMEMFEKYGEISSKFYENFQNMGYDIDYHRLGSLMYFSNQNKFNAKKKYFEKHSKEMNVLNIKEQKELAPLLKSESSKSFLINKNAHLDPEKTILSLKSYLQDKGVVFIDNEEIIDFESNHNKISKLISKKQNSFVADEYIIATGSNLQLNEKLGKKLNIITAKGYSATFSINEELKPKIPILIADKFMMITPRKNDIRITSKLEIGSSDRSIDANKINEIISIFKNESKNMNIKDIKSWSGLRALSPNDKPSFGRDNKYNNITYAMGLGWLGMTFAPAIGEIVSDIVSKDIKMDNLNNMMMFSSL